MPQPWGPVTSVKTPWPICCPHNPDLSASSDPHIHATSSHTRIVSPPIPSPAEKLKRQHLALWSHGSVILLLWPNTLGPWPHRRCQCPNSSNFLCPISTCLDFLLTRLPLNPWLITTITVLPEPLTACSCPQGVPPTQTPALGYSSLLLSLLLPLSGWQCWRKQIGKIYLYVLKLYYTPNHKRHVNKYIWDKNVCHKQMKLLLEEFFFNCCQGEFLNSSASSLLLFILFLSLLRNLSHRPWLLLQPSYWLWRPLNAKTETAKLK